MAVSNQDIIDFLLANPGMSDADIGAAMATYGVSPSQMAKATGLSEGEVTSRLATTLPSNQATLFGDTYVQPIYTQIGAGEGYQQGPLENVITYKASDNKTGGAYQQYTPSGELERTGTQQAVPSFAEGLAPVLQAVLLASGAGGVLGGALGLTGAAAQGVGTGLITGGSTALAGGSVSDVLKAGLLGGGGSYLGNTLSDYISANTPIDASQMTQAQFNDSLEGQLVKSMQNAGLTNNQITAFLDDMGIGQGITPTTPVASVTPVSDAGSVNVTAPVSSVIPALTNTTAGLLSSVPSVGTVNVTDTKQPQQIDQSVLNLINSQIAANAATPTTNVANVQVTGNKGLMSGGDTAVNDVLNTVAGLPTTTPTQTITASKPATTAEIVNAITSTLPNVTPTQAATVAEQIITSGKPVTTQEVINAITASLPTVTAPTTTTVPTQTITADKPSSINDVVTAAAIPLITPTTPLTPTPVKPTNPLGLTDDQIANLLKVGVGLLGGIGGVSVLGKPNTTPTVGSVPTQTPPMYTADYFTKVQQNYNRILPAVPRDVATPLRDWYTSQYGA